MGPPGHFCPGAAISTPCHHYVLVFIVLHRHPYCITGCKVPTGWKLHHVDLSGTVADIITFKAYTASDGLGVSMGLPDTLLRMSLAPSASSPSKKQAIGALTWPDMGQVKLPDLSLATEVANDLVIRRALPDFDLILVEVLSPTVEINPLQGLSLTADVRSGLDLFDLDGSIGLLLQPSHGLALQFDLTGSIPGIPVTLRVSGLWTTSITKRLDVSLEAGAARAAGSITLDLGKLAFEGEVDIPKIGIVPELHLDLRGEMDLKDRRFSLESSLSTNLWNVLLLDGKLSIPSRGKADVDCSISTRSLDPIQIDGRLTANMQVVSPCKHRGLLGCSSWKDSNRRAVYRSWGVACVVECVCVPRPKLLVCCWRPPFCLRTVAQKCCALVGERVWWSLSLFFKQHLCSFFFEPPPPLWKTNTVLGNST